MAIETTHFADGIPVLREGFIQQFTAEALQHPERYDWTRHNPGAIVALGNIAQGASLAYSLSVLRDGTGRAIISMAGRQPTEHALAVFQAMRLGSVLQARIYPKAPMYACLDILDKEPPETRIFNLIRYVK